MCTAPFGQGSALQKVPNGILMGVTFVFENVDNDSWFGVFYGSSVHSKTEMDPCQICDGFSYLSFPHSSHEGNYECGKYDCPFII